MLLHEFNGIAFIKRFLLFFVALKFFQFNYEISCSI